MHKKGPIHLRQSLAGYYCPECRGKFKLRPDGTNECRKCGFELVTEWEWERRQAGGHVGPATSQLADDIPGSF